MRPMADTEFLWTPVGMLLWKYVFYVFLIRALMLGIFAAPQSNLLNL